MSEWVLGIDTSTEVCVGLARDGVRVGAWRVEGTRSHAEQLQVTINAACAENDIALRDLSRVAVGLGPGPFTGLRVGIVTARTIAALAPGFPQAVGVPKGVCSLDVMARQFVLAAGSGSASAPGVPAEGFVVVSDARRKELYWARYDADGQRVGTPQVSAPDQVAELPVVGTAAGLYPDVIGGRVAWPATPLDAGVLAAGIDDLPDAGIEPLYLRKPDATVSTTRKSALVPPRLQVHR